jgi:hypothetical protein
MARPREELHGILKGLDGVTDAYFQPKTNTALEYPCIIYSRDESAAFHADNLLWWLKKRYSVIVIDRNPDSLIPELVEGLPYVKFDRFYVSSGLNHFVFNLFF